MASAAQPGTLIKQAIVDRNLSFLQDLCTPQTLSTYTFKSDQTDRVRQADTGDNDKGFLGLQDKVGRVFRQSIELEDPLFIFTGSTYEVEYEAIYTRSEGRSSPAQGISSGQYDVRFHVKFHIEGGKITKVDVVETINSPITQL